MSLQLRTNNLYRNSSIIEFNNGEQLLLRPLINLPGDDYVDILGMDNYHDMRPKGDDVSLPRRLAIVSELAAEKGKVSALTETGQEAIPESNWWTKRLLNPIKSHPDASQIAYVMVWRNARKTHHYGPYPSHPSNPDFLEFIKDNSVIMQDKLPNMYRFE